MNNDTCLDYIRELITESAHGNILNKTTRDVWKVSRDICMISHWTHDVAATINPRH